MNCLRMSPGTVRKPGAILRKCSAQALRSIFDGRRYWTIAVIMGHTPPRNLNHPSPLKGGFFHNLSKRSVPHIFKFIALFLGVPCFYVSHYFFKRAYVLQARQPKTLRPRVLSRRLGLDLQIVELLQHTGNRSTRSCRNRSCLVGP